MEQSGQIGTSPAKWDVSVDAQMNLGLSLSYVDPGSGASLSVSGKAPVATVLDQLVGKLKSPIATEIEQGLVAAIELYLKTQPAPAAGA